VLGATTVGPRKFSRECASSGPLNAPEILAELFRLFPNQEELLGRGLAGTYFLTLADPDFFPLTLLPDLGELSEETCDLSSCEALLSFRAPGFEKYTLGMLTEVLVVPGTLTFQSQGLYVLTLVRLGTLFTLLPDLGRPLLEDPVLCEDNNICSLRIQYSAPRLLGCCTPPESVFLQFPLGVCRETSSTAQCMGLNGRITDGGCSSETCVPAADSLQVFQLAVTEGAVVLKYTPADSDSNVVDGPLTGNFEVYLPPNDVPLWLLASSPPPIKWSYVAPDGSTFEGNENDLPFPVR